MEPLKQLYNEILHDVSVGKDFLHRNLFGQGKEIIQVRSFCTTEESVNHVNMKCSE